MRVAAQAAGNIGAFALDTSNHDTGNGGSIGWTFIVSDGALDFLAAGQTLTQKYDVTVNDGQVGGTATQTVTITITANEVEAFLTSAAQAFASTEDADGAAGENTDVHSASGAV